MSCKEAMSALVNVVEHGGAVPEEQREHIKHCARCRELLDSAEQFQAGESETIQEPNVDEQRLTDEVRGVRHRDVLRRILGAALFAAPTIGALTFWLVMSRNPSPREIAAVMAASLVAIVIPVLIFYFLFAALRDRYGNRIYKRLGPGRQLAGVCFGLSEATGVSVVILRLIFFVLLFVKGLGFWLYIALYLAMPVHPDDRQHLLRFKLRRAWQRRLSHADNDAG
jgi:phage shock protein PspC (stress-responsive transcriptional regulator)